MFLTRVVSQLYISYAHWEIDHSISDIVVETSAETSAYLHATLWMGALVLVILCAMKLLLTTI